jgi:pyruvate/oxaloacetate carboxyltransferase
MVGKIFLHATPRDTWQSDYAFAVPTEQMDDLIPLIKAAGFSGYEQNGGNRTVAEGKVGKSAFKRGAEQFAIAGNPKSDEFEVDGLIRELSINRYGPVPDDLADLFFKEYAKIGNSVRIFSGANDFDAIKRQIEIAKKYGLKTQVDYCLSQTHVEGSYDVNKAEEFFKKCVDYGADQVNFKIHSGNADLEKLEQITKKVDEILPQKIKFGIHTHSLYENAEKEIATFVNAISSNRNCVVHVGPGEALSNKFGQPGPRKVIELFPNKTVYNEAGLQELEAKAQTVADANADKSKGTLKDKLHELYSQKTYGLSGDDLSNQVERIFKLFEKAGIPGGGALYTVNDLMKSKAIGDGRVGNFGKRDYLEDYLNSVTKFREFDGSAGCVTPFYFLREQNTKFFLNPIYYSKDFKPEQIDALSPETLKISPLTLKPILLGKYGQMPVEPNQSLVDRCIKDHLQSLGFSDEKSINNAVDLGKKINELYTANKTLNSLEATLGAIEGKPKEYFSNRKTEIEERLEACKETNKNLPSFSEKEYVNFLKTGTLPDEIISHLEIDANSLTDDFKKMLSQASVQKCTPSAMLEPEIRSIKDRITKGLNEYFDKCNNDGKPLTEVQKAIYIKHAHNPDVIITCGFIKPDENPEVSFIPHVIAHVAANELKTAHFRKHNIQLGITSGGEMGILNRPGADGVNQVSIGDALINGKQKS